jgi:FkbM family methyltransferase
LEKRQEINARLAKLLCESVTDSQARSAQLVRSINFSKLALFGAGTMGRKALARLRAQGVQPIAFIDDTPEKQGTTIDGIPVYGRQQATVSLGPSTTVAVTMLNPRLTFARAQAILAESGFHAVSLMALSWAFPDSFTDIVNTPRPDYFVAHRSDIQRCQALWADDRSRQAFDDQMAWRLTLDFDLLPAATLDQIYFPSDIDLQLSEDVTFIDAGAYDGDSVAGFIAYTKAVFGHIVAIEPDPANFKTLQKALSAYVDAGKATLVKAGLGAENTILRFSATGDMSAAISTDGSISIDIKTVETIYPDSGPVYLKFDIEGAEWEALCGARNIIETRKPKLAISIYHDPRDLWRIPLLIRDYLPDARLYLRAHGVDGTDVVLYAV